LWLLSGGGSLGAWNAGDTLVMACAVAYSAHIIVLGSIGRGHDPRPFAFVQLVMTAVVCGAVGLVTERPGLPTASSVWMAIAVTGILASAVAFAVQTYAQRHLSPTRTALILISEPAFGGLFGWLLGGEVLGLRGWAGAALILSGMVASELLAAVVARRDERTVLEPTSGSGRRSGRLTTSGPRLAPPADATSVSRWVRTLAVSLAVLVAHPTVPV
jgi:drug/metabolite transporter (DMT)-like permease